MGGYTGDSIPMRQSWSHPGRSSRYRRSEALDQIFARATKATASPHYMAAAQTIFRITKTPVE
jgi:hypothetical protein